MLIREIGLVPTKSKNIVKLANQLLEKHDGMVPANYPDLEALPGGGTDGQCGHVTGLW